MRIDQCLAPIQQLANIHGGFRDFLVSRVSTKNGW
jgi:hypothetical protein